MTKDKVLAALVNLSPADRAAIKAVIEALDGGTPIHPSALGHGISPGAWLIEAMGAVLGAPLSLQGASRQAFNKNAPVALAFIEKHFTPALKNKTTALALMRYLLRLLVSDLQSMKVPVTRNTLAQNLHRIGEVFGNSFPGYAEGQVAALVLASILSEKT